MGIPVFYSYSHKDERFKDDLETQLTVLKRNGYIDTWDDRRIAPGSDWKEEINTNMEKARIILLLISADFLASDYCYETETIFALEQHEKKKCIVIPIILKPCLFSKSKLYHLQALPKNAKPLTQWKDRSLGWLNIAEGIIRAIEDNQQNMKARDFSSITFGPLQKISVIDDKTSDPLEQLVIRFLSEYNRWYFSPLRIQKWGSKQEGFESLADHTTQKIRLQLKNLLTKGKVKTTESRKGNILYKLV